MRKTKVRLDLPIEVMIRVGDLSMSGSNQMKGDLCVGRVPIA